MGLVGLNITTVKVVDSHSNQILVSKAWQCFVSKHCHWALPRFDWTLKLKAFTLQFDQSLTIFSIFSFFVLTVS